jgi:glycosyltransferase involved in cell wall biosynthesis
LWWGKRRKVPVIYDAHEYYAELTRPRLHGVSGSLLYHLIRLSEHTGARLADAVITVDETLASRYRRLNKRVLVVGHYPPSSMAAEPAPVFSRPELTLLYQGRISTDRGMLLYVDALRVLRERGIPARLVLAGVFTPAAEETSLRKAIEGMEEFVDLPGWVPFYEMGSLLHSADIGLAVLLPEPRYVAALPVKLFEYMAAGLPVIASRFPLIEEVVTTSFCGALVDPRDGAGPLADVVEEWWHHPQDALSAGARGREAVLEHYNWETLVERLVDLYRSLDEQVHPIPTPPSVT